MKSHDNAVINGASWELHSLHDAMPVNEFPRIAFLIY